MGRFLIFFSYLGNRFSGVQKQTRRTVKGKPLVTVQGALLDAMRALRPKNEYRIVLSSRTDKGVHALRNSCHVDLQHQEEGLEYSPTVITNVMNYCLQKEAHDVRVLETRRVPDTFHSRLHARGRKYIYRLGHTINRTDKCENQAQTERDVYEEMKKFAFQLKGRPFIPYRQTATPLDSCTVSILRTELDIGKLVAAAGELSGIHDFTSFSSTIKRSDYTPHPVKLLTIGVKRGQELGSRLQRGSLTQLDNVEFWDIHIEAKSFLYKMVRRVVGAMVLHARDVISLEELRDVLKNPRHVFPFAHKMVMKEGGLFLQDVEYCPEDLEFGEQSGSSSFSCDPSLPDLPLGNSIRSRDSEQLSIGEQVSFLSHEKDSRNSSIAIAESVAT